MESDSAQAADVALAEIERFFLDRYEAYLQADRVDQAVLAGQAIALVVQARATRAIQESVSSIARDLTDLAGLADAGASQFLAEDGRGS